MIGQKFATEDDYVDATTCGRYGYPIQVLVSVDSSVLMQFAKKDPRYAARVTWELQDVEFPQGDYRFGNCYGIRFKTVPDADPANVYVISVMKEDPTVQGFSPSN